jgi:predicted P-loop ATPase
LNDPTGETRPLVIEFGLAESEFPDWDAFDEMLPQLYAQAIDLYRKGERPYLKSDEERHLQKEQNEEREMLSTEQEMLNDFLAENKGDVEQFGTRLDEIANWCKMSHWSNTFGNGFGRGKQNLRCAKESRLQEHDQENRRQNSKSMGFEIKVSATGGPSLGNVPVMHQSKSALPERVLVRL